jgi:hypothetical protein
MAITVPNNSNVRVAHDFDQKPGAAGVAITAAGPLAVSPTGSRPDGLPLFVPAVAANRRGYIGFGFIPCSVGAGLTALRNTIVAGFAGVEPGKPVYIADNGSLTHTKPTAAAGEDDVRRIGIGYTANLIALD